VRGPATASVSRLSSFRQVERGPARGRSAWQLSSNKHKPRFRPRTRRGRWGPRSIGLPGSAIPKGASKTAVRPADRTRKRESGRIATQMVQRSGKTRSRILRERQDLRRRGKPSEAMGLGRRVRRGMCRAVEHVRLPTRERRRRGRQAGQQVDAASTSAFCRPHRSAKGRDAHSPSPANECRVIKEPLQVANFQQNPFKADATEDGAAVCGSVQFRWVIRKRSTATTRGVTPSNLPRCRTQMVTQMATREVRQIEDSDTQHAHRNKNGPGPEVSRPTRCRAPRRHTRLRQRRTTRWLRQYGKSQPLSPVNQHTREKHKVMGRRQGAPGRAAIGGKPDGEEP